MQLRYRSINYLSTAAQRNPLHLTFTSLQFHFRNALVGTETEMRPLQLTATYAAAVDYERNLKRNMPYLVVTSLNKFDMIKQNDLDVRNIDF